MKTGTKILIGTGVLAGLGIAGYFLLFRNIGTAPGGVPNTNTGGSGSNTNQSTQTQTQTPSQKQQSTRVSTWPEGQLLRGGSDGTVWVIDSAGYRRAISSYKYFESQGWSMSNVKSIPMADLIKIPEAMPLGNLLL